MTGIRYELDTTESDNDERLCHNNRRPLLSAYGTENRGRTRSRHAHWPYTRREKGSRTWLYSEIGITRTRYGFRKIPYGHAGIDWPTRPAFRAEVGSKPTIGSSSPPSHRFGNRFSQIGVADFRGFGNDALDELPRVRRPIRNFIASHKASTCSILRSATHSGRAAMFPSGRL